MKLSYYCFVRRRIHLTCQSLMEVSLSVGGGQRLSEATLTE